MPVRKAVIPAAGLGTRFLPASKAVPKELITVVDRPVIQYAVEELVRAGVTDICIVSSHGKEAVTDHFGRNPKLEAALEKSGKTELLEKVRRLHELADVYSVRQNEPLGLGHAVWCAREHMKDEPFVVLLPDELFDPQRNFLADMLATFEETERSVVAVHEVPMEEIRLYGCVAVEDPSAHPLVATGVVEKPDPSVAPSNLALSGRYVLVPEVFEILAKLEPGAGGEIQLADACGVLAERGDLLAEKYVGRKWDAGTKIGYLKASFDLALDDDDLGDELKAYLAERGLG